MVLQKDLFLLFSGIYGTYCFEGKETGLRKSGRLPAQNVCRHLLGKCLSALTKELKELLDLSPKVISVQGIYAPATLHIY